ncbi:MAG TPA: hypothetical protein PLO55_12765 [Thermotogota bacterium]|nr:hypothetical protein [Thermotogota bacterium]
MKIGIDPLTLCASIPEAAQDKAIYVRNPKDTQERVPQSKPSK